MKKPREITFLTRSVGPLRNPLQMALFLVISVSPLVLSRPVFTSSEIEAKGSEIVFCDLDGDRLEDILLIDRPNLILFFQDAEKGFAGSRPVVHALGDTPSVVWPAKLDKNAESLLIMTHEGVDELSFAGRKKTATPQRLITQKTLIPQQLKTSLIEYLPLSVNVPNNWPVILIPTGRDLQLWYHRGAWQRENSLKNVLETRISAPVPVVGYDKTTEIDLGLGDVNSDRRDDIIVRTSDMPICKYVIYTQQEGGFFTAEPTLTFSETWDWLWYCWLDINRDGRVDLIKNKWLGEPWFLPGTLSGKVIVQIHLADAQGKIPVKPQQVFRKNDWIESIPIVDVDGDGHMDLVLGYNRFDTREGFRKAFMAKRLDFNLRFHLFRPGMGYPEKPDFLRDLEIHLDQHSIDLNWGRRRDFERFVDLSGDFDGDGDKDLLFRDSSDRVSVYSFISRQIGFEEEPSLFFDYKEPIEWFKIVDLNNDGVSDLVMKCKRAGAFRVFLSDAQ